MSPRKRLGSAEAPREDVTVVRPEDYAAFIQQIELRTIWLVSAQIENRYGPSMPKNNNIVIRDERRYENRVDSFDAFVNYRLSFGSDEDAEASGFVEATFGLRFSSEQPMTDPVFAVFSDVNLPVNAWPFLREFLQTATARMGWPALTLPTFKAGAKPAPRKPRRSPSPPSPTKQSSGTST